MSTRTPHLSLKQLELLAKKPVVEAEGQKFWTEFTEEYSRLQEKHPAWGPLDLFVEMKSGWLKAHCPPIRFAGQGSSRAVFALDGGLCLKIATSEAGIAQNKAEWANITRQRAGCFPKPYETMPRFAAVLVEAVAPLCLHDMDAAVKLLGLQDELRVSYSLFDYIAEVLELCLSGSASIDAALKKIASSPNDYTHGAVAVARVLLKPKNSAQKVLKSLAEYVAENSSKLSPNDLATFKNWGFAARDGKTVLVVLDAGLNGDVAKKWYS